MRIGVISNGYPLTPEDYPGIFNRHDLSTSLPASPLEPAPAATGFRWDG